MQVSPWQSAAYQADTAQQYRAIDRLTSQLSQWVGELTKRPSHDAVKKSMLESYTIPKPWWGTLSVFFPLPKVIVSNPTLPATAPVPYVISKGYVVACSRQQSQLSKHSLSYINIMP